MGVFPDVGGFARKPPLREAFRHTVLQFERRLPDYMVPSALEEVPAIPMTVSDKADLSRLPKPARFRLPDERRVVRPRNGSERFLAGALAKLLGFDGISVDDHFFDDLGANSLLMAAFICTPPWRG